MASESFELLYTPQELADVFKVSPKTIQRWFDGERGVMRHGEQFRRDGKKPQTIMRIPHSVAMRVYKSKLR
jgi:AraC-like DNA-binding protein